MNPHSLFASLICLLVTACSSAQKAPAPAPAVQEKADPKAVFRDRMIHPDGMEISDVEAILRTPAAPKPEALRACDSDYHTEVNLARTREELFMTLPEHVRHDPELYHWCFFSKLVELEAEFSKADFVDEKQKILLRRYPFFVHIGRIFLVDFEDPRYLEFATHNYRRLKSRYFSGQSG